MSDQRFAKASLLFGPEAMDRLARARVVVFGVGGVGSYAVEALCRSGIGALTLVDSDTVCESNINRQIHALTQTLGRPKVEVMAERCRQINPHCEITPLQAFYDEKSSGALFAHPFDYLLDCIDTVTSKLHLIETALAKGIPVISAMGAANKFDPSLIRVDDLSKTTKDRLAKSIRKLLRKRGITKGVQVVYSTEEFHPLRAPAPDLAPGQSRPKIPLGSSSFIPPIFGLTMASVVINQLAAPQRDSSITA